MVGMQAIAMKKPVITMETACYSVKGLVSRARGAKELADLLNTLPARKDNARLREEFLSYAESYYCIPGSPIVPPNQLRFWLKKQKEIMHDSGKSTYPSEGHWRAIDVRLRKMIDRVSWLPDIAPV